MPILDRRSNQFIEDKDTRVSVGIDFPFARVPNQDGYFSTTKTTIESVKNNIRLFRFFVLILDSNFCNSLHLTFNPYRMILKVLSN